MSVLFPSSTLPQVVKRKSLSPLPFAGAIRSTLPAFVAPSRHPRSGRRDGSRRAR